MTRVARNGALGDHSGRVWAVISPPPLPSAVTGIPTYEYLLALFCLTSHRQQDIQISNGGIERFSFRRSRPAFEIHVRLSSRSAIRRVRSLSGRNLFSLTRTPTEEWTQLFTHVGTVGLRNRWLSTLIIFSRDSVSCGPQLLISSFKIAATQPLLQLIVYLELAVAHLRVAFHVKIELGFFIRNQYLGTTLRRRHIC